VADFSASADEIEIAKDITHLEDASDPDNKDKLDLYIPAGDGPHPVQIFIHGGLRWLLMGRERSQGAAMTANPVLNSSVCASTIVNNVPVVITGTHMGNVGSGLCHAVVLSIQLLSHRANIPKW
jgi:hypothetical protein